MSLTSRTPSFRFTGSHVREDGEPSAVCDRLNSSVGFEPVKGRILDLGSNGATIDLSRGEGRTLRVGDTTQVSLALYADAPAASLLARIRSCESAGSKMRVGLEFEGPFDPDAKDLVDRFVVERLLLQV